MNPLSAFTASLRLHACSVFLSLLVGALASTASSEETESETENEPKKEKVRKVASVDKKVAAAPSAFVRDGSMTLRNVDGNEIQATLISALGDSVKIQRVDDQREFIVPISTFDDHTTDRIRSWMEHDPEAISYSLSVNAQKNLVETTKFESSGREFETAKWSYRVTVSNQSRNLLRGATLEYRIIYDDKVAFGASSARPGKGINQQEGQAIDLPDMDFNDQIEFDTPGTVAHSYRYSPTRGKREYSRDSIKGIWVRISRNGQIVAEYQSSPSALASVAWDNEDSFEIEIRNRFRDSFGTKPNE